MVELAIILPLVLILIIGTMEMAWVMWKNTSLTHGTREGVRRASLNNSSVEQIKSQVMTHTYGVSLTYNDITVTKNTSDTRFPGQPYTVTIRTSHHHDFFLLPIIGLQGIDLSSRQDAVILTYPGKETPIF